MTEEEKKAIEYLKEEIKSLEKAKIEFSNEIEDKGWLQKNINELDNDILYKNTLLNLIEKLQKENEEKSGIYQQAKAEIENLREKTEKYYVLIYKIREKIKELEQQKDLFFEKTVIQGRIDLLKEIMQEEK